MTGIMAKWQAANDPSTSPPFAGIESIRSLAPIAIALLTSDESRAVYGELKQALRRRVDDDPIDALLATVLGGGLAFYLAERETNPACQNPWDGVLYVATCLSVGYDNLFPTTAAGHAIATIAQTFGPALAGKAFDEPNEQRKREEDADVNRAILARLDDIVRLLEAQREPA